jgi:riboflavin synthase
MFTGIVSNVGTITKAEQAGDLRLTIACSFATDSIKLGDSVACNGVCLTVIEIADNGFSVELSAETISCTAKNQWQVGRKLNLERSLRMGDSLDGHLVSGHVDGIATIGNIEKSGDSHILTLNVQPEIARFIAQKGSVTLDGISLTINNMKNNDFSVNIIPHTWKHTALNERKIGDQLNLEIDMLARYVARLLESQSVKP